MVLKFKPSFLNRKKNAAPSCLGNNSKDVSVDIMKKTGLYGFVHDFSVDYDSIDVDDILNNHKYVMKSMA